MPSYFEIRTLLYAPGGHTHTEVQSSNSVTDPLYIAIKTLKLFLHPIGFMLGFESRLQESKLFIISAHVTGDQTVIPK